MTSNWIAFVHENELLNGEQQYSTPPPRFVMPGHCTPPEPAQRAARALAPGRETCAPLASGVFYLLTYLWVGDPERDMSVTAAAPVRSPSRRIRSQCTAVPHLLDRDGGQLDGGGRHRHLQGVALLKELGLGGVGVHRARPAQLEPVCIRRDEPEMVLGDIDLDTLEGLERGQAHFEDHWLIDATVEQLVLGTALVAPRAGARRAAAAVAAVASLVVLTERLPFGGMDGAFPAEEIPAGEAAEAAGVARGPC